MIDIQLDKAILLINQQRYSEAEKILGHLSVQAPNDDSIISLLAEVQLQKDNYDGADELINTAIALNPDEGNHFSLKARIYLLQDKFNEAENYIREAVRIAPYYAAYFAIWAQIKLLKKEYPEALEIANEGLEVDPNHVLCLNMRSTALLKLNRKEESFHTIAGALNEDPNNYYTHANYGWGLLEKGDATTALAHFREALSNNPNSEHAQAGMREALKAKFMVYRWFLQYAFWISNKAAKYQWYFILGFYFGTKALQKFADSNESLQPFIYPVVFLLFLVAFSTWIITPVSNLFLRLNAYGKHLLDKEDTITSTVIGICVLTALLSAITYFTTSNSGYLALAGFMFTMMIPLSQLFLKPRAVFFTYNVLMCLVGSIAVIFAFSNGQVFSGVSIIYILGLVAFQFITNYFLSRQQ